MSPSTANRNVILTQEIKKINRSLRRNKFSLKGCYLHVIMQRGSADMLSGLVMLMMVSFSHSFSKIRRFGMSVCVYVCGGATLKTIIVLIFR